MKAIAKSARVIVDDLVSLSKIVGAVLVVGLALGMFRYASGGALAVFY